MLLCKIILTLGFLLIFYQDIKDRQVYWFLFPIVGVCAAILLYQNSVSLFFYWHLLTNLCFVLLLLSVVFLYSKYKLKVSVNDTFGLGDILLFIALVFTFASISFIILFIFGLIFSLILHLIFKHKSTLKTVPLAGYLSLFFTLTYIANWLGFLPTLYIL